MHYALSTEAQTRPIRILHVEDDALDAELVRKEIERTWPMARWKRVDAAGAFEAALREDWDLILSDDHLPGFSSAAAFKILERSGKDIPFVIVSGAMADEAAVAAMKCGANDFVSKDSLGRLVPLVSRELSVSGLRTDRAQVRKALHLVERELSVVLGSSRDRVFTLGPDGRVTAVYGAPLPGEGRSVDLVGCEECEVAGVLDAGGGRWARALGGENMVYRWSVASGGELHYYETALSPIVDSGIVGAVGVIRDTTDAKRLEAQLVMSDRMVSVGTLAAGVGHEINNPLACVIANLSLAIEALAGVAAGLPGEALDELLDALAAARHVRSIVQDLRIFSRGEEETTGPVDVGKVVESSVRMAWNEIKHRARLVKRLEQVPPVRGTESRLGQVMLNLLINAAQAITAGRADENTITVSVVNPCPGWVTISVADTGAGITPENREKLFTPFFTTKPVGVGTGLGLSICHRIVTALGGRITVESAVGRGTTFTVTLPIQPGMDSHPETGRAPVAPGRRGRVLVIDDDAAIRTAVRRALAAEHEVVVDPAPQGVRRIQRGERFDVVLCDLMMPILTGADVHAAIRAVDLAQSDRMLFMTGGIFNPAIRAFLEKTPLPVLMKPFDPAALRDAVNRAMGPDPGAAGRVTPQRATTSS